MNLTVGMSFVRYFHITYQACFAAEHLVRVNIQENANNGVTVLARLVGRFLNSQKRLQVF